MNYDEFSFFNQQLANMVRDGIPLETALRQLSKDMRAGKLRSELELLQADLANGVPLRQAISVRDLPEIYRQMIQVGAQSSDLPTVLTMLADHYRQRHLIWTKLKGLMVYPAIVLTGALVLSIFLAILLQRLITFVPFSDWIQLPSTTPFLLITPVIFTVLLVVLLIAIKTSFAARILRWRLPAFKEASLAQFASTMALLLKNGVALNDALALLQRLEIKTRVENDIALWRQRLASGRGKFSEMAEGSAVFPKLFVWTVAQTHEDLSAGFERAAEIYQARAAYRSETLLYTALPCSVLILGLLIVSQLQPVMLVMTSIMEAVGGDGK